VENIFVRVQAEDGSFGIGSAAPEHEFTGESADDCRKALADDMEPLLNRDIRPLNALCREAGAKLVSTPAARAAIDIALHDLLAEYLNVPLTEMLGRSHQAMPKSITIGI
jgi:L-alanine-DL-glutamate epimerase-like enolase superfamily enzyme